MRLEDQVVSLDLAKRLKELGVKQESLFWWNYWLADKEWRLEEQIGYKNETLSAFTVAELGELLKQAGPEATIKAYGDLHNFKGTGSIGSIGMLWLLTEPDRLAKMLIFLLKNNLTT